MAAVARMIGADPDDLPFVGPDSVQLSPTHSVAGNPNRHDTGVVQLRAPSSGSQPCRRATGRWSRR